MKSRWNALVIAGLLVAGCDGDPDPMDGGTPGTDAGDMMTDAGGTDAGHDAGGGTDGGATDGGTPGPTDPIVLALSESGHDRIFGVTHDADGNILVTGQIADTTDSSADFETFVARLTRDGALDSTFGTGGILRVNVAAGGTSRETGRAIAVQSTGRIIVLGAAEHDPSAAGLLANDTDFILLGVTAAGALDTTFGTDGIDRADLGTAVVVSGAMDTLAGADAPWGLGIDSMDRIVVHGATITDASGRTDTDFVLARRLANGGADTAFGDSGRRLLDIGMADATGRSVTVLSDDSVIGVGYMTSDVLVRPAGDPATTSQQPVLWKLTSTGAFDTSFATADATTLPGVWHDFGTPLPERRNAEAYHATPLSDGRLVTMGYGPTPGSGTSNDWVSFRFSAAGDLDATYGTGGLTYIDTRMVRDSGRFITTLPGDRTLACGRSGESDGSGGVAEDDGLVAILSADGVPDETFGTGGFRIYDVGDDDQFWSADVHEDGSTAWATVGGVAGGDTGGDDDAVIVILPL